MDRSTPKAVSTTDDKEMDGREEEEVVERDLEGCGCYTWQPRWLQRFNSARWLVAALSLSGFMRLMIEDGFTNSVITSIERRFQLRSQDVGTIISIYEITTIIFMLPVSYLGGRGNKPRWISAGIFLTGIASLLFALPHFTTDNYAYFTLSAGEKATCMRGAANSTSSPDSCGENEGDVSSLTKYVYVFGAAKVISGLGAAPAESLPVVLLDESLTSKQNGICLSIYFTMGAFGTAVGYLVTGVLLGIYTDIYLPAGVDASPTDPGWVGAWWIAFVVGGFVIILVSIPIALFPRELPKTAKVRSEKFVESHKNSGAARNVAPSETPGSNSPGLGRELQGILKILKHLVINPTYLFTACASVPDILLINSYAAFLPKLLENQFMVTSSIATIVTGVAIIPGSVMGIFLGGWLMRRFKLKIRGLLKLVIVSTVLKTVLFFIILIHCPQGEIAGITVPYSSSNASYGDALSLSSTCNEGCGCSNDQFKPVCADQESLGYFSPCHAGCQSDHGNGTYGDCSCLSDADDVLSSTVYDGKCSGQCSLLPVFVVLMNILLLVMFLSGVPYVNVILRSVAEHERPVAVGLTSVAVRVFGSIPGPILFGKIIDQTCLQWQETCGTQGACWLYDSSSLAWRLATLAVACNLTTVLCSSLALRFYKPTMSSDGMDSSKDSLEAESAVPLTNGTSADDNLKRNSTTETFL